ncbi:MAG: hypothetical protein BGP12_21545 [Rhodospirillales bacterium 70-18]|nr:sugar phosphate isomerase/epimerase [Rhodospirillales bacterium]OJY70334.1 MAG: hypothetical protein BGP12_21545 [Rhodospirillales bacterium 70-18]
MPPAPPLLAVSNLAIPATATSADLAGLRALGVRGLEVAPTRLAAWEALAAPVLVEYRDRLDDAGLVVSSLQALLFGTTGLHLLGEAAAFEAMRAHLRHVAAIGGRLGARVGVFGSPRNRLRGALPAEAAWALGRERLGVLARTVAETGFALGLEPVPPVYGGDFLTRAEEVIQMVTEVDHPGLVVHLDTGCVMLGGDSIAEAVAAAGPLLGHFHIAEPKLGTFDAPQCEHDAAAAALRAAQYRGWIAIEMLEQPEAPMQAVRQAVTFAAEHYLRG